MNVEMALSDHLARFQASPVLFVGSGLSRRYCGMEDWSSLLSRFSDTIGKSFQYYLSSSNGNLPKVASLLSKEFHEQWWNDDKFLASREMHKDDCTDQSSALKIEISKYINSKCNLSNVNSDYLPEIELLQGSIIDGIITTNWDCLMESIFPDYVSYVGQEDVIFRNLKYVGEIFKIHGCCTRPNSLLLTEQDYQTFEDKFPYLSAKLLTMFVEHPVLFIGYSLSDKNISQILESIGKCLRADQVSELRDRIILVKRPASQEEEVFSDGMIRIGEINVPTKVLTPRSYAPVFRALSKQKRRFPARLLRQLKEQVYDLVLTNDPKGQLYVQDIDGHGSSEDPDVVFGVGAISKLQERGHIGVQRYDILRDILFDNGKFDPRIVLDRLVPREQEETSMPVFKYLRNAGLIDEKGTISTDGLHPRVTCRLSPARSKFQQPAKIDNLRARIPEIDLGVSEIYAKLNFSEFLYYAALVPESVFKVDELTEILKKHFDEYFTAKKYSTQRTYFAKLICLIDWMKYRGEIK